MECEATINVSNKLQISKNKNLSLAANNRRKEIKARISIFSYKNSLIPLTHAFLFLLGEFLVYIPLETRFLILRLGALS